MSDHSSTIPENLNYDMEDLKGGDSRNILPTDDQLDRFVDSLCDNFPALQIEHSSNNFACDSDTKSNLTTSFSFQDDPISNSVERNQVNCDGNKDFFSPQLSADHLKIMSHKKSAPNSNLNVAILQCSRSLELLVERRKHLESHVRKHQNVTNINYNVSYSPRLPDTPTRVDRLLYDINQERCRILGLMTALETTINSFSSRTAKEDLRKLLVAHANAIVDVIKERQNEINSLNGCGFIESGVHKLVELVDEVHRINRQVHSALWCIEVKEQFNSVMPKPCPVDSSQHLTLDRKPSAQEMVVLQKSWSSTKLFNQENQLLHSPRLTRAPVPNFGKSTVGTNRPVNQPQQSLNLHQMLSPPSRPRKSTAYQLYAQEQRAEIFQRFSSSLRQTS